MSFRAATGRTNGIRVKEATHKRYEGRDLDFAGWWKYGEAGFLREEGLQS